VVVYCLWVVLTKSHCLGTWSCIATSVTHNVRRSLALENYAQRTHFQRPKDKYCYQITHYIKRCIFVGFPCDESDSSFLKRVAAVAVKKASKKSVPPLSL
jgi:hypothetical protein